MSTRVYSILLVLFITAGTTFCQVKSQDTAHSKQYEISKSEEEWKSVLSEDEYYVLRQKGTEYAFTGKYNDFKKKGVFTCAACDHELFDSKTKYESGSGWPSFYKPISENAIDEEVDNTLGMQRTEVLCSKCGGHLGHVFADGPKPTGMRYCVNSVSLNFKEK